tara:strand:- start:1499 stop:1651 length:153 start_codon:yes stop_codon:yes gene_type:complete
MIEVKGDLWEFDTTYTCITTNRYVKVNGEAVMRRRTTVQAKKRYPEIARE